MPAVAVTISYCSTHGDVALHRPSRWTGKRQIARYATLPHKPSATTTDNLYSSYLTCASTLFLIPKLGQDGVIFQSRHVTGHLAIGSQFLEQAAHDLAAARFGQCLGKANLVRLSE